MGCKLHTLLLANSCLNPEEEAFKKLNMISRYPLTVPLEKRVTAEKLSRVLLINLIDNLQQSLDQSKSYQLQSENARSQGMQIQEWHLAAWRNMTHIIQLCEEMMYTSNNLIQQEISTYQKQIEPEPNADEKNARNINLNLSLLDWQRSQGYLLYFETRVGALASDGLNGVSEYTWAEWELLQSIFQSFEGLYDKLGVLIEDEKAKGPQTNTGKLLSSQQYQVSNQMIQEKVYEALERVYQTSKYEQDVQLLMRECLVGSQITPRGNGFDSQQLPQGAESLHQPSSTGGKFPFPLGALGTGRLKNIKLQFQPQGQSQQLLSQQ